MAKRFRVDLELPDELFVDFREDELAANAREALVTCCHQSKLKFACDRRRYLYWVFEAKKRFSLCVLNYMQKNLVQPFHSVQVVQSLRSVQNVLND
jgi:hypothetical protein